MKTARVMFLEIPTFIVGTVALLVLFSVFIVVDEFQQWRTRSAP